MMWFAGQLSGQNQHTVGTLDLGGASTQITFLPRFEVRSGCKHSSQDHNASGKTWAQLGSVLSFCQLWHKQNISDVLNICTAFPFGIALISPSLNGTLSLKVVIALQKSVELKLETALLSSVKADL